VYHRFEQLWFDFLTTTIKAATPPNNRYTFTQPLPELKFCLAAFDECTKLQSGINLPNAKIKINAMDAFIDSVDIMLTGQLLSDYR
jgi:hypothetical protein